MYYMAKGAVMAALRNFQVVIVLKGFIYKGCLSGYIIRAYRSSLEPCLDIRVLAMLKFPD